MISLSLPKVSVTMCLCDVHSCHAPSWLDPGELSHMCIHLMTDCDLTQLMHHHAWAMQNILWLAISDIDGHLWAGRDSMLTACTPYSFTLSIIYFGSCNQFHVHMYISHWEPGEQSPSLEIIFNSESHAPHLTPLAGLAPT